MKDYRRARFLDLLNGPPWRGDRARFGKAAGITNGRISQLLDPAEPFGDNAARRLCEKLGLPPAYFDPPHGAQQTDRDRLSVAAVAIGATYDRMNPAQQELFLRLLEASFGAPVHIKTPRPNEFGHSGMMDLDLDISEDPQSAKGEKKHGAGS